MKTKQPAAGSACRCASVAVSNLEANTGSNRLLVTNRTQTFGGPGIDLTSVLAASQPYLFKIAVRLSDNTPSAADTVRVTMKSVIGGATNFSTVASSATVTNTGWVMLQGTYTPPSNFSPPPTGTDNLFMSVEDDTNAKPEILRRHIQRLCDERRLHHSS